MTSGLCLCFFYQPRARIESYDVWVCTCKNADLQKLPLHVYTMMHRCKILESPQLQYGKALMFHGASSMAPVTADTHQCLFSVQHHGVPSPSGRETIASQKDCNAIATPPNQTESSRTKGWGGATGIWLQKMGHETHLSWGKTTQILSECCEGLVYVCVI